MVVDPAMKKPLALHLKAALICALLAVTLALPLLWAIGLVLPLSVLLVFGTLILAVREPRAWSLAWPWFLVGGGPPADTGLTTWFRLWACF